MGIPADSFFLDPGATGTLQQQIRQLVAGGILSGRFHAGERMPSSRALARQLGVSRITVTLAYTDLVADDYLTARGRSGYFVSDTAPEPRNRPPDPGPDAESTVDWSRVIGTRAAPITTKPADWASYPYPFIYGQTDPALFDLGAWRLCAQRALGRADFDALTADQYDADDQQLVDFLTRQTLPRRGITASPDEILITLGAQNALWLSAELLLTQRRTAAIEDPSYPPLRTILSQTRCHMVTAEVDDDGLDPATIPEADVVYCTPSHQCPTTATMPLRRRRALLDMAEARDFLIVEDDYDFEMSFIAPPLPALKSLDRNGRVIYVGSFSKSIFPGLRLGYLVGPAPFIAEARRLRASVLRHPPGLLQRTTAHFLSLGHYDSLIRRMSRALRSRREILDAAIAENGLTVAGRGVFGGSALWMAAPEGIDAAELDLALRARGVLMEPGAPFFADQTTSRFYRIAYSSIREDRIAAGIGLIAEETRRLRSINEPPET